MIECLIGLALAFLCIVVLSIITKRHSTRLDNLERNQTPLCAHEWDIREETLPSIVDSFKEHGGKLSEGMDEVLFRRKHIQLLFCKKCGEVKRYVTKTGGFD